MGTSRARSTQPARPDEATTAVEPTPAGPATAQPAPATTLPAPATPESATAVDDLLARTYPGARCALHHDSALQLLLATVLSAQTTDARVNEVTPELFDRWPDAATLGAARHEEVEAVLRPLGFQRRRAAHLVGIGQELTERFGGQVPADRDSLVSLPGVGRKTANVVLGNAFGVPALTVDTHVGRLSRRLGWTVAKDPLAVERDLAALLPRPRWTDACHRLIEHGRALCHARAPRCGDCPLLGAGLCPQTGV